MPTPAQQLESFLSKFNAPNIKLMKAALKKMRARLPGAVQMVYDNYNFLVVGFGPNDRASQAVFSLALYARGLGLCFLWGARVPDPDGLFEKGSGKQVRFIKIPDAALLDDPLVHSLMTEALLRAPVPESLDIMTKGKGALIIKSVSAKQRPRKAPPTSKPTAKAVKKATPKAKPPAAKQQPTPRAKRK